MSYFCYYKKNLYKDISYDLLKDLKIILNLSSLRGAEGLGIGFLDFKEYEVIIEYQYIKKFVNDTKFNKKIL